MSGLFPLRPLQQHALDGLRQSFRSGKRRVVIQAPCGFGKTVLAAHIVDGALRKRKRTAFTVPMLSLIDQTFDRFVANGINPGDMGVMQGDHAWRRPHAPVQICSVQTLSARGFPENIDSVVVDECHLRFKAMDEWMRERPDLIFTGLSATPWSRGMGNDGLWQDLVIPTTIKELIALGWLSKFRVFAPDTPDLSGVKITAGDYNEGQLSAAMSDTTLVGDCVANWLEHGENRPTLAFGVDRAHAATLHEGFLSMGVASAYVDGNTPREERLAIIARYQAGEVKVICSVGTMTTGVDVDCRCLILARPTRSEILFVQMIGRGLRTADGKEDCLIFDHTGMHTLPKPRGLGMVTDIHHERLRNAKTDAEEKEKAAAQAEKEPAKPRECSRCKCLIPVGSPECPNCGNKQVRVSTVVHADGQLAEIGAAPKPKRNKMAEPDFIAQLRGYAKERGMKDGWVAHKFKAYAGVWPNGPSVKDVPAAPCGPEVRSWIRSENIRWANSRSNHGNQAARAAEAAEMTELARAA